MKVFIVFLGLLIMNVSFLSYQGDMIRYVRTQVLLKSIAEECAAGSALYYDEGQYADGHFVFDYEDARKYTEFVLNNTISRSPFPQNWIVTYDLTFQDDLQGYYKNENGNEEENPSVTAEINVKTEDLFTLPFIDVNQVTRISKYELPGT